MNTNLQERPQSKRRASLQQRPPTRTIHKQQAQKCFNMAKQHQIRKQYKQAIKLYAETVVHNPNFYKAYCNVGVIYRQLGQIHDAIASYIKALQIKKDDFKTLYNLGNSYRLIGNNQKAINAYKLVLEGTGKDQQLLSLKHDTLNNLGISYQNVYQYEQAIQCYQKVIAAEQKFQGGYYNKALCLMCLIRKTNKNLPATLKMRINEAQKSLNKVLQINPNNLLTSTYLIELKYIKKPEKNTYEQCIQNFKTLLNKPNIMPNIQDQINRKIGFCLAALQKFEQSTKYYKDGTKKSSTQLIQQNVQPSQQKKQVNKYDENDKIVKQKQNKPAQIEQIKNSKNNNKSLESLQQKNVGREVNKEIEVPEQKINKQQISHVQQNKQKQSNKQLFNKQFKQIVPLIQSKNYKEALRKLENFTICDEKYNQQILLNAKATQQYEDILFAKRAINLYVRQIIGKRKNKEPLFADCTIEAHRALAECYTILGQHQQAIKHYKLISEWSQSNMHERDIDLFVESGLGINYESLGLYNDAIECYKKSLEMQPDNYHTLYNLANCYLQNKKEQQAYTMLEKCMQKINSKEDWMILGDCYINKALIQGQRNQKNKELDTLQKLMKLFDENCKSLQQLKANYNSQMLIEVYLELAMLIQEKLQTIGKNQMDLAIIQQNKNKLLNIYMTLLDFPQCPDKQEIILNCGNIHFQKKQYVNSVYFYHSLNQQLASNYLGLTYLFLGEFGKSHGWLTHSVSSSLNNSIYTINLALVDWLFAEDSQYTKKYAITAFNTAYSCKCDRLFDYKLLFAKQFIIQLTQLLTNIQQNLSFEQINQKIQEVIKNMKNKSKSDKVKLSKDETSKLKKRAFIFDKLDNHCRDHSREKQLQEKEVVQLNELKEFFTPAANINECFKNLLSFIKNIDDNHPLYPTIIQTLLSIFIISNSEQIKEVKETFSELVLKQIPVLALKSINKPILNNASEIILQKGMHKEQIIHQIREWERELQEIYTPIVEDIKTKYWLSENITQPIKMFYNFPRCRLNQQCQQCFLKSYAFLGNILDRSKQLQEMVQKHRYLLRQQKIIKSLEKAFCERTQKALKIRLQKRNLPITLHWYFNNPKSVEGFLQQLSSYNIQAEGNRLIINNIVDVEVHIGKLNYVQDYISKVMDYPFNINTQILAVFALDNQNQRCFPGSQNEETFNAYLEWKKKNNLIEKKKRII